MLRWVKADNEDQLTQALDDIGGVLSGVQAEANKRYDRANGRTVSGPEKRHPSSYQSLLSMTDQQLGDLPPEYVAEITRRAQ